MTEELKAKLTERFKHLVETSQNGFSLSADIEDALLTAYLAGGEYGYQYAKKRLREVLGFELDFNVAEFDDGVTTESLVDKICNAMEK